MRRRVVASIDTTTITTATVELAAWWMAWLSGTRSVLRIGSEEWHFDGVSLFSYDYYDDRRTSSAIVLYGVCLLVQERQQWR
jgi:hypothetical protein